MSCAECDNTIPFQEQVIRGETLTMYGRLTAPGASGDASPVTAEGNLVKRADVSSISLTSISDGVQIGTTQSLTVATVIYQTIQTTGGWENVDDGGNALLTIPASLFETPNKSTQINATFTMADSTAIVWLIDVTIIQPARVA